MTTKYGWLLVLCLVLPLKAMADGAVGLSYGVNGDYWTGNYAQTYSGYEVFLPVSTTFQLDPNLKFYGQSELAVGNYIDANSGPETITLRNVSDTVLGGVYNFKFLGLPSLLNVAFNVPTGDPSWESKEFYSEIPTEFVDSRYRGRGFGVSALYGISLPETKGEFGIAGGYLYSGAFNPSYSLYSVTYVPGEALKLGDAVFLALNHIQPDSKDASQIIRFSVYYSEPTQLNGQDIFQLGTNFNASYAWMNAKGLSLEIGAQAYLPSERLDVSNVFGPEDHNSYAPRFYITPSFAFGDFVLSARAKYILTNDYPTSDINYDGGGWLVGIEPSYRMQFDKDTSFKFAVSFDDIDAVNYGVDTSTGNRADVNYQLWSFSTVCELKI